LKSQKEMQKQENGFVMHMPNFVMELLHPMLLDAEANDACKPRRDSDWNFVFNLDEVRNYSGSCPESA
jgi:hypothetical protein